MIAKWSTFAVLFISCLAIAKKDSDIPAFKEANKVICPTKKTCLDKTGNCKCWCSHKCEPREREEGDAPVYVNDDKYGNYCYCKQWDLDNVSRCPLKTTAQESSNDYQWAIQNQEND